MPGRKPTTPQSGSGSPGGYQQPATPAAVSGPGMASARTDGATPKVALDGMQADHYGQRQELEGMAAQTGGGAGGGGGGETAAAAGPSPDMLMDVFRPSEYPADGVPATPYGAMTEAGMVEDPDVMLRALYEQSRHPDLARLLAIREGLV